MGQDGAAAAGTAETPAGLPQPAGAGSGGNGRDFFVLRTGCQWNALRETTICSSSSAHRRFQEWLAAGVFAAFWREGLLAYDGLQGIDWMWWRWTGRWAKHRWVGKKTGRNPTDRGKRGVKRSLLTEVAPFWWTVQGVADCWSVCISCS